MLYGLDVSNFLGEMDFSGYESVIIKASEGWDYQEEAVVMHNLCELLRDIFETK